MIFLEQLTLNARQRIPNDGKGLHDLLGQESLARNIKKIKIEANTVST